MIHSFTKVKDRVRYILEKYPNTRDDDNKMIWLYIFFETHGLGIQSQLATQEQSILQDDI